MSQPGRYLKSFPNDIPLDYLGRIKKGHNLNRKSLFVEAVFEGEAKKLWVPVELLPFLIKGRAYGKVDKQKTTVSKQFKGRQLKQLETFYIRNVQQIKGVKVKSNNSFYFKLFTANGDYLISAFELARALYFRDKHLVDAAFRPNGLFELASYNIGDKEVEIRFPETTEYPASNLNCLQTKQHLINLFLNEDYRKSFGSIFAKRFKAENSNNFHFNFVPPNLDGLHFEVLCKKLKNVGYLVYEVRGIQNRSFFYDGIVRFIHPRKKDVVKTGSSGESGTGDRVINRPNQSDEIDLDKSPGLGKKKKKIEEKDTYYQVLNSVRTIVNSHQVEKETGKNSSGMPQEGSRINSGVISAGKKLAEGSANFVEPHLSGGSSISAVNEGGNTVDRFRLFIETIDSVVDALKCKEYKIFHLLLPKPEAGFENDKWKNLITAKPRLVCVAQFHFKNVVFVALDVDIADLSKSHTISSRLVVFKNDDKNTEKDKLKIILQALSNSKTISWPSAEVFDKICDLDVRMIHPAKKLYEHIEKPQDRKKFYISYWAEKWQEKIKGVFK